MPTCCVAVGCRNTANPTGKTAIQIKFENVMKITFHSFPSDSIRRAEWIRIMKLDENTITNRSRLCSIHFKEKYIDRTSLVYVRLRENAIPHIFEDTLYDDMETVVKCKEETLPEPESVETTILTDPFSIEMDRMDNLKQISVLNPARDKETNTSLSLLRRFPYKQRSTVDKETRISPERIWNMNFSNMETIRQERSTEIKSLRKQIQALQRKLAEKNKKIAVLKIVLEELQIEKLESS
ncbi:52 kDa repressor of the inhibitor of the protein kinase-like [Nylanderia fulva]|uniref:52 kDa repressor of the inhibitor of the protein kinase-like n=1 Tax=Nylanderia fulva TaxID=613905 RepID=UPI0010FBA23D|nr:52 kDa repressor of the inhibitor of the protein kinase-like [Nylanderia fulva]